MQEFNLKQSIYAYEIFRNFFSWDGAPSAMKALWAGNQRAVHELYLLAKQEAPQIIFPDEYRMERLKLRVGYKNLLSDLLMGVISCHSPKVTNQHLWNNPPYFNLQLSINLANMNPSHIVIDTNRIIFASMANSIWNILKVEFVLDLMHYLWCQEKLSSTMKSDTCISQI